MSDESDRRAEILAAEQAIRTLHQKMVQADDRSGRFDHLVEILNGTHEILRDDLSELKAARTGFKAAMDDFRASSDMTLERIEDSIQKDLQQSRMTFEKSVGALGQQQSALSSVVGEVRENAEGATKRVQETYLDARGRLDLAKDELIGGRKDIVRASEELRFAIEKLEHGFEQIRGGMDRRMRRLEILIGLVSVTIVALSVAARYF